MAPFFASVEMLGNGTFLELVASAGCLIPDALLRHPKCLKHCLDRRGAYPLSGYAPAERRYSTRTRSFAELRRPSARIAAVAPAVAPAWALAPARAPSCLERLKSSLPLETCRSSHKHATHSCQSQTGTSSGRQVGSAQPIANKLAILTSVGA